MGHEVIVVTGASIGFGRLTAEALALAGHTVYALMRGRFQLRDVVRNLSR